MKVNLCTSTVEPMLTIIEGILANRVSKDEIEEILNHPDYQMEFARYEGRVSKNDYMDYLLNFMNLKVEDIPNRDLKTHHQYYLDLANNLEYYKSKLNLLSISKETLDENGKIAQYGLPDDLKMDEINAVSTLGIGQSYGYVYQNNIHFDYLQLVKDNATDDLGSIIAHEIHHVGLNSILNNEILSQVPLEGLYYLYFSGEGLAVKYCNNAEGVLSKSIYQGKKNIGLDPFTWNYLNNDFENTMKHFIQNIEDIRTGKINTPEALQHEIFDYWMNPFMEGQSKNEIPKLKHFRLYSFGNDIWGIIHDCFGREQVFELLRNPEPFPLYYNMALELLGKKEYQI